MHGLCVESADAHDFYSDRESHYVKWKSQPACERMFDADCIFYG